MNRRDFLRLSAITAAAITLPLPAAIGEPVKPKSAGWFIDAEKGYDYVIGIHTGIGAELSVISVLRVGKDDEPVVQVAELVWPGDEKVLIDAKIVGREYGKYLPDGPLFSIEQVRAPGDILQHQLKFAGFRRFYKTIRYRTDIKKPKPKEGWYSISWSRPLMTERFITAQKEGHVVVKSPLLTRDIVGARLMGKSLMLASGGNDHRFMASAIAYSSVLGVKMES
jgi:hypothetical protein